MAIQPTHIYASTLSRRDKSWRARRRRAGFSVFVRLGAVIATGGAGLLLGLGHLI
jgi:hypothetical protein